MPKNMGFEECKLVNKDPLFTTQPAPKEPTQKESITDIEALPKKNAERKKYLKVANVLKEPVSVTKISKRILDLVVSLTVGELLASAPRVGKQ